ncbi:MAG TPA: ABC transporter permease [Alloiococcus sp.]|nr:ABC transporter permease [Alloiococcus sp.]
MSIAWKDVKKNKGKYTIIILVLVCTMYLVFFTIGLTTGLRRLGASKIMNSPAETFILSGGSSESMVQSSFSGAHATDILEDLDDNSAFILGVRLANMQNLSDKTSRETFEVAYFGMDPNSFMMPEIEIGRTPENEQEVIASSYLQAEGVQLGDTIYDVNMNVPFTIVAFTNDETYSYSPIVYLNQPQYSKTTITGQMVGFATVQAIVSKNEKNFIPDYFYHKYDIDVVSKEDIVTNIPGLLAQRVSFLLLIISMYIISGTILAMFFYIITIQKKKELGQLKALGASTSYLLKMMLAQVGIVVGLSVLISVTLIYITNIILPSIVPFLFSWSSILTGSVIFLTVAILGSIASLWQVINIDPIIAIGGNN